MTIRARRDIVKTVATGAAAIAASYATPSTALAELHSVSVKFNLAPTTSENLTITLNASAGAAYDVVLYSVDPSATSMTSLMWSPDEPVYLEAGDSVDVAYTNTDTRTYGVQLTTEVLAWLQ